MARIDCRYFNGYKPCGFSEECTDSCTQYQRLGMNVLIVHLGALGAVLRATCILKPLRRKFPHAKISWVTDAPGNKLLEGNPMIDKVYTSSERDLLQLKAQEFDAIFCVDKAARASGIVAGLTYDSLYGFSTDRMGKIIPANQEARELWQIGLSDYKKFFVNKKPETQLMTEALGLEFRRDLST